MVTPGHSISTAMTTPATSGHYAASSSNSTSTTGGVSAHWEDAKFRYLSDVNHLCGRAVRNQVCYVVDGMRNGSIDPTRATERVKGLLYKAPELVREFNVFLEMMGPACRVRVTEEDVLELSMSMGEGEDDVEEGGVDGEEGARRYGGGVFRNRDRMSSKMSRDNVLGNGVAVVPRSQVAAAEEEPKKGVVSRLVSWLFGSGDTRDGSRSAQQIGVSGSPAQQRTEPSRSATFFSPSLSSIKTRAGTSPPSSIAPSSVEPAAKRARTVLSTAVRGPRPTPGTSLQSASDVSQISAGSVANLSVTKTTGSPDAVQRVLNTLQRISSPLPAAHKIGSVPLSVAVRQAKQQMESKGSAAASTSSVVPIELRPRDSDYVLMPSGSYSKSEALGKEAATTSKDESVVLGRSYLTKSVRTLPTVSVASLKKDILKAPVEKDIGSATSAADNLSVKPSTEPAASLKRSAAPLGESGTGNGKKAIRFAEDETVSLAPPKKLVASVEKPDVSATLPSGASDKTEKPVALPPANSSFESPKDAESPKKQETVAPAVSVLEPAAPLGTKADGPASTKEALPTPAPKSGFSFSMSGPAPATSSETVTEKEPALPKSGFVFSLPSAAAITSNATQNNTSSVAASSKTAGSQEEAGNGSKTATDAKPSDDSKSKPFFSFGGFALKSADASKADALGEKTEKPSQQLQELPSQPFVPSVPFSFGSLSTASTSAVGSAASAPVQKEVETAKPVAAKEFSKPTEPVMTTTSPFKFAGFGTETKAADQMSEPKSADPKALEGSQAKEPAKLKEIAPSPFTLTASGLAASSASATKEGAPLFGFAKAATEPVLGAGSAAVPAAVGAFSGFPSSTSSDQSKPAAAVDLTNSSKAPSAPFAFSGVSGASSSSSPFSFGAALPATGSSAALSDAPKGLSSSSSQKDVVVPSAPFSFGTKLDGSGPSGLSQTAPGSSPFTFGAQGAAPASSPFGSLPASLGGATPAAPASSSSSAGFGSTVLPSGGLFSFGNTPSTAQTAAPAPTENKGTSGFSFPAAPAASTSAPAASASASPFQFGSSTSQPGVGSGGFSFGSATAPAGLPAASPAPFAFGSAIANAAPVTPGPFTFGQQPPQGVAPAFGTGPSWSTAGAPLSSQFGAGAATQLGSTDSLGGYDSTGSGSAGLPQGRRVAKRRLPK